jgi:hypothetical protein
MLCDPQNVDGTFKRISDLGFRTCELYGRIWNGSGSTAAAAIKKYNMQVLALFTLGPGPTTRTFMRDSVTSAWCWEYRQARMDAMYKLSDLAKACNIAMIETHVGYIPENPLDPNYGRL